MRQRQTREATARVSAAVGATPPPGRPQPNPSQPRPLAPRRGPVEEALHPRALYEPCVDLCSPPRFQSGSIVQYCGVGGDCSYTKSYLGLRRRVICVTASSRRPFGWRNSAVVGCRAVLKLPQQRALLRRHAIQERLRVLRGHTICQKASWMSSYTVVGAACVLTVSRSIRDSPVLYFPQTIIFFQQAIVIFQ